MDTRWEGYQNLPNLSHTRASLGRDPQKQECRRAADKNRASTRTVKGTVCPIGENTPEYKEGCVHINDMLLKNKCVADMRSGSCRVFQNLT